MRTKSTQGFTLIELLIVIAIIGILAAVLIPNLMSARSRAQDVAAQACAKDVLTQAEIFAIDKFSYSGFTAPSESGYEATTCIGGSVGTVTIDTNTTTAIGGSVASLSGKSVSFSNSSGVGPAQ